MLIEALGWAATAAFVVSYFFKRPERLVRAQMVAALMWVGYGVLVHAIPVIAANVLVFGAAAWKARRTAPATPREAAAALPDLDDMRHT